MNEEIQGPQPGDEGLNVEFYWDAVKHEEQTAAQGRPVFRDVEYIRIKVPGNNTDIVERPVREIDKLRWPDVYWSFKSGAPAAKGTLLRAWNATPKLTPSQVKELDYFGIQSVEQLALVSDGNLARIGPYREWREKARAFVKDQAASAPVSKLREAAAVQQSEIAELRAEIERLKGGKSR